MELSIEALGLSKDEVAERVVDRMVDRLLADYDTATDEDGEPIENSRPSRFCDEMKKRIGERIDKAIDEIASKNVLPNLTAFVESFTMQETNKWGERTGKKLTFTEYLVARAENYLTEKVDFQGKAKDEHSYSSSWNGTQTRVSHMIHQYLHYTIETAMKQALGDINKSVAKGLNDAVKIKLEELVNGIKTTVEIKK